MSLRVIYLLFSLSFVGTISAQEPLSQKTDIPYELNNLVIHYRYENGWIFHVLMSQDGYHWEGVGGAPLGKQRTVHPFYSKIADGIYFLTWKTNDDGFDSVVLNFNTRSVNAHNGGPNSPYLSITGEIFCLGFEEKCKPPNLAP